MKLDYSDIVTLSALLIIGILALTGVLIQAHLNTVCEKHGYDWATSRWHFNYVECQKIENNQLMTYYIG